MFSCSIALFFSFVTLSLIEENKHNHGAQHIFVRKYAKKSIDVKQSKCVKGR